MSGRFWWRRTFHPKTGRNRYEVLSYYGVVVDTFKSAKGAARCARGLNHEVGGRAHAR